MLPRHLAVCTGDSLVCYIDTLCDPSIAVKIQRNLRKVLRKSTSLIDRNYSAASVNFFCHDLLRKLCVTETKKKSRNHPFSSPTVVRLL